MSIYNDLSTVTTMPLSTLERISDKLSLCMLHKVYESEKVGNNITQLDMTYGTLCILHNDDEIKYKFIPSKVFEEKLKNVILTGESPLISAAEDSLKEKITTIYKDLF